MSDRDANLVEMFSSIQGEGMYVGLRQAFIRFYGCSMSCEYCDSGSTLDSSPPETCRVERVPGTGECSFIKNPVSLGEVRGVLENWFGISPASHHSISLTGGEPLLHATVLKDWLPSLRCLLPIFLETNGIMHQALSEVIDHVDYISMDMKLPSTTGSAALWEEHLAFMRIASRRNLYVKAVVGNSTTPDEIRMTCETIRKVGGNVPLILQPLTSGRGEVSISARTLLRFQEIATELIAEVRVIPQTHIYMGLP